MFKLDDINLELIKILQKDSKKPYRDIQEDLGLSTGTIHNRIAKFKKRNAINYTININFERLLNPLEYTIYLSLFLENFLEEMDNLSKQGLRNEFIKLSEKLIRFLETQNCKEHTENIRKILFPKNNKKEE